MPMIINPTIVLDVGFGRKLSLLTHHLASDALAGGFPRCVSADLRDVGLSKVFQRLRRSAVFQFRSTL